MKAVHVANSGEDKLFFLLETDKNSESASGAIVASGKPVTYIDFFSYVSRKRSIDRIMNTQFHNFFWTGHSGELSERWQIHFIERLGQPDQLSLSGIEVLTEFESVRPKNRKEQLNAKSNRAIEIKSLIGAGMNEKAFTSRPARTIGHAAGNVATGAVRGFRRGVRFDPDAEDADGDGFVQEGSQHARRVARVARRAATSGATPNREQGGMRSFLPPVPSLRMGATEGEVKAWRKMKKAADAHIGGNDPKAILAAWDELEDSLAKLNGEILRGPGGTPEPIKKVRDARRIAEHVHPRFSSGESYYDLLEMDPETELTEYQKAQLVGVLTALQGNPLLQNHTLNIVDRGKEKLANGAPNPDFMGGNTAGYQKVQTGTRWLVDQEALQDLHDRIDQARQAGTLNPGSVFGDSEFEGAVGDNLRQLRQRNFVARLGELFKLNDTDRPGQGGNTVRGPRPTRIEIGYRAAEEDELSQVVDQVLFNPLTGETIVGEISAGQVAKRMYSTADAVAFVLFNHSDSLPEEEARALRQKAIAIRAGNVMVHEVMGHGIHTSIAHNWGLQGTGETDLSVGGPAFEKMWASTMEKIVERIADMEGVEKLLVYEKLRLVMDDDDYGLSKLLQGRFGLSITHAEITDSSTGLTARGELPFGQGGLNGILASANIDDTVGTEAQRNRIRDWMKQPVMDPDGNPYVATEGLARYFSGDDAHSGLQVAALHEWGIDLTIAEGDPLTLGHVLYGTTPAESGINAFDGAVRTHKKGKYSQYRARNLADRSTTDASSTTGIGIRPIVRKARNADGGKLHEPIAGPNDGGAPGWVSRSTVDPTILAGNGIPALDTGSLIDGGRIKTPEISPEDTAPLLGALAVVAHTLRESKWGELDMMDEDGSLDKLTSVTFDAVPDVDVGLTGKTVPDLLRERSPAEAKAFREDVARSLAGEMAIASLYQNTATEPQVTSAVHMSTAFTHMPPGDAISRNAEGLMLTVNTWDGLAKTHIDTLTALADRVGYHDYSAYAGTNTGWGLARQFLGESRHEMIAEFIVHLTSGVDLPIYDGRKRRGLTPAEVKALKAFYEIWMPGRPPVIRANGEIYE